MDLETTMNTEQTKSGADAPLRGILREACPNPELPPRFSEAVWRRIEQGERQSEENIRDSWVDHLVALVLRPRLALAAALTIILVGSIVGAMNGAGEARQAAQVRYVSSVAPDLIR